jgi:hypothetical protein
MSFKHRKKPPFELQYCDIIFSPISLQACKIETAARKYRILSARNQIARNQIVPCRNGPSHFNLKPCTCTNQPLFHEHIFNSTIKFINNVFITSLELFLLTPELFLLNILFWHWFTAIVLLVCTRCLIIFRIWQIQHTMCGYECAIISSRIISKAFWTASFFNFIGK